MRERDSALSPFCGFEPQTSDMCTKVSGYPLKLDVSWISYELRSIFLVSPKDLDAISEGPRTQYLRTLVQKIIPFMAFETRVQNIGYLDPLGEGVLGGPEVACRLGRPSATLHRILGLSS